MLDLTRAWYKFWRQKKNMAAGRKKTNFSFCFLKLLIEVFIISRQWRSRRMKLLKKQKDTDGSWYLSPSSGFGSEKLTLYKGNKVELVSIVTCIQVKNFSQFSLVFFAFWKNSKSKFQLWVLWTEL